MEHYLDEGSVEKLFNMSKFKEKVYDGSRIEYLASGNSYEKSTRNKRYTYIWQE
jgi:hypothetical protein